MDCISERHGSRVITYYITEEGCKYPSFEWLISRVDTEEDKTSIFRLERNSIHIYKIDYNAYYIIYSTIKKDTLHKFEGMFNWLNPKELILTHQYYKDWFLDLEYIETIFCDPTEKLDLILIFYQ